MEAWLSPSRYSSLRTAAPLLVPLERVALITRVMILRLCYFRAAVAI